MTVKETYIVEQFVKWKSRFFMFMLEVIVGNISFIAYFFSFYIKHFINWSFKPLNNMNIFVFQIFKFCWKVLSTFSLFADMQMWYGIFLLFRCSLLNWLDVHHWWDSSCNLKKIDGIDVYSIEFFYCNDDNAIFYCNDSTVISWSLPN